MAWYDPNRNRGYNTYGIIEPGYGGRKHAVVGYSAAASESYVTSEKFVEYGNYPGTHSSTGKELYKDVHGGGDGPLLRPWSSTRDWPKKSDKSSPSFSQSKASPWRIGHAENSPPRYHYGKHNNDDDNHKYDSDDEDDVMCENGYGYPKSKYTKEEDYVKGKNRGNGYASGNYPAPQSTQPRKDPYYDTPHSDNYIHENNKGNSYSLPSYIVPVATQPMKDPYYETSNKRAVVHSPPAAIKTRPDTSKGHVNYLGENRRNSPGSVGAHRSPFKSPSPVSIEAQRSPFTSPPMKDQGYQETIDSAEAQRRYGRASPMAGAQFEQKHTGTIDSKEAARRYNGVFVNY